MKRRPAKSGTALSLLKEEALRIAGHVVGQLVAVAADGPHVTFSGNPHGPLPARSIVDLPGHARSAECRVLLVFEEERSDRPIIVGLLRDEGAFCSAALAASSADESSPSAREPAQALLDGKRVVLEAQDEIVLRCGKASITLRRNGRVVIRGAYVETRAEGVNRVKGGSVQIN